MNIKRTLTLFSITILSACLILAYSATRLYTAFTENKIAAQQELALTILAKELAESSDKLTKFARVYAATAAPQAVQAYMHVMAERAGQVPRKMTRFLEPGTMVPFTDLMAQHGCTPDELTKVTLANELSDSLTELEIESMNAVKGLFKDTDGKYNNEKEPDIEYARNLVFSADYEEKGEKIQKLIDEFFAMLSKRTHDAATKTTQAVITAILFLACTIGTLLLLAIAFAYYARVKICIPLEQTAAYVLQVRENDLQTTATPNTSQDEIGILAQGIVNMVHSLANSLAKAEKATQEACAAQAAEVARQQSMLKAAEKIENILKITSPAAIELMNKIQQSKAGAEQQAARIASTATAMEEMNNTVAEVSHSAGSASEISVITREKAEHGEVVVQNCMTAIDSTGTAVEQLKKGMDTLTSHTQAISQLTQSITDTASQANLLVGNAAAEAARAGEAGRGFAAVLTELRQLAEKTIASSTDVENTARAILQATATSMAQVDDTVQNVRIVTQLAGSCGQALHEIVDLTKMTANQVQGIALASKQQSIASEEIAHSITEISAIAEETTLAMREAKNSLDEVTQQRQQLSHLALEIKR